MYRVKEIFKTIQGEGVHSGTAAIFIRFVGCNMWSGYEKDRNAHAKRSKNHCALWCDTDFTKEGSQKLSAKEIVEIIKEINLATKEPVKLIVVTGGEPMLQLSKNSSLIKLLRDEGYYSAIETNGTVSTKKMKDLPDWICCSPKVPEDKIKIERIDELKLVFPYYRPEEYKSLLPRSKNLFLQPCDEEKKEGVQSSEITTMECAYFVMNNPEWKISVQIHKMLGVD